jgi:hypothetical protein
MAQNAGLSAPGGLNGGRPAEPPQASHFAVTPGYGLSDDSQGEMPVPTTLMPRIRNRGIGESGRLGQEEPELRAARLELRGRGYSDPISSGFIRVIREIRG